MDNKQYLEERRKTFYQNQFGHLVNSEHCNEVIFKPNNSSFSTQGAVTSSSLILRKKYTAITKNADKYLLPYGSAVSNAMTYGVSESVYTYKNKFAFPTKKTPTSKKNTDTMNFCVNYRSKV
jgi:hypothetical protein